MNVLIKRIIALRLVLIVLILIIPSVSFSHSGRTDSTGCHNDNINGGRHCHNTPTVTYSWYSGAWGSCSGDCGSYNGIKSRNVYCKNSSGSQVSDFYCSGSKPSTITSCTASICEVYTWSVSEWSGCNGDCGESNGTKNRIATCSNSTGSIVSDFLCTESKPLLETACTASICEIESVCPSYIPSSGILNIPQILYSQLYYQAQLGLDTSTGCFQLDNYSIKEDINNTCIATLNPSTGLLYLTLVDVELTSFDAVLEQNNNQFCLTNSYVSENGCGISTNEYSRNEWRHWSDIDGDCQDTRVEVLIKENEFLSSSSSCTVSEGRWYGIYTNEYYSNASDLDIDHIVSLSWAHSHGGENWSSLLKETFANDMSNLLPVSASANRSKGSKAPYEWLPENNQCVFIDKWEEVVEKYNLCLSTEEKEQLSNVKTNCI